METNIVSYEESESTLKIDNINPSSSRFHPVGSLSNINSSGFIKFTIDEKNLNKFFENFRSMNQLNSLRNDYCVLAIRNLIKKNEFLQLSLQLSEKLISEDEFENEVETNPERYIIKLDNEQVNLSVISNILSKIGKSFTTDQVSEIFSIDPRLLKSQLQSSGY
jgi:hypothetical protein